MAPDDDEHRVSDYRERRSALPGSILWESSNRVESDVLPDGCMDLVWLDGQVIVAGPDTEPFRTAADGQRVVGLRLAPGLMPLITGVPASELPNQRVPLSTVRSDRPTRILLQQVDRDPGRMLEAYAQSLTATADSDDLELVFATTRLLRTGQSVSAAAARLGMPERQLHRRSLHWYGYGPKTLARILRLQRALVLARAGKPSADVGAAAGYADQSHLNRESRVFTGRPFGALRAAR